MFVSKKEFKPVKLVILTAKQPIPNDLKIKLNGVKIELDSKGFDLEISILEQQNRNVEMTAHALISEEPDLILLDSTPSIPSWPIIQICADKLPKARFFLDGPIDIFLKNEINHEHFSGIVRILHNGKELFAAASGDENLISKQPNTVATRINIGSITKMLTAVAVLKMTDDLQLDLHQPIYKLLEEKKIDYPHKALFSNFTLHELLTHTSGLGNGTEEPYFKENMINLESLVEFIPWISGFVQDKNLAERNKLKTWSYSNPGYVILGLAIEAFTHENYHDYVRNHIFHLTNMTNTFARRTADPLFAVNHGFPFPPPIEDMSKDLLEILEKEPDSDLQKIGKELRKLMQSTENFLQQEEIHTLQNVIRNLELDLSEAKTEKDLFIIKSKYRDLLAKHCRNLGDNQILIDQLIKCMDELQKWLKKFGDNKDKLESIDHARQLLGITDGTIKYLSWKEEVLGTIVTNLSIASPAGKWYSTVDDLLTFHQALWSKDGKLAPYLASMLSQPVKSGPSDSDERYGYGIAVHDKGINLRIGHTGKTCGSQATYDHFPNAGFTVITLSNDERDGFRVPENIERFLVQRMDGKIIYLDPRINPEAHDILVRNLTEIAKSRSSISSNTYAPLLKILGHESEIKVDEAQSSSQGPASINTSKDTSSKRSTEEENVTKHVSSKVKQKNLSPDDEIAEETYSIKK